MAQEIALVTGASSGIGAATAKMLAREGFFVYAAARSMDKLNAMKTDVIQPLFLDLTDSESIRSAVEHVRTEKGRIDVLVSNAGYGGFGLIEGLPIAEARRQFDVNVFGAMELIQAVLPTMRTQRSGRILQLGSIVSHISMPALGWYAASKHAIRALCDALRLEVKQFGVHVVMIEPGAIASGFENVALESLEKADAPEEYKPLVHGFTRMIQHEYTDCPGPEIVVAVLRKAVLAATPKEVYTDRFGTWMNIMAKHWLPNSWFHRILERRIMKT